MKGLARFTRPLLPKAYLVAALVAAGIVSPPVYAAIPLLSLLLYLYLEYSERLHSLRVPANLFFALSLPLLFQPLVGMWASPVLALPVVLLLDRSLRQSAMNYGFPPAQPGRRPTRLCTSLVLSLLVVGVLALALNSWGLLLSTALLTMYLGALVALVLRATPAAPAESQVASHRVVAGALGRTPVSIVNRSALAGHLALVSPHTWLHIWPVRLVLNRPTLEVEISFTPPLGGPTTVSAEASFMDPWGLVRFNFSMAIADLFVIPRARYAEWLARRYLEVSRAGALEAITTAGPASQRGSRRGTELYGLRSYQPGDSARAIDWKHTLKLHQIVVKEFQDTGVECAIIVINLLSANEEEQDRLAASIITTGLTLARENIPSAITAYDDQDVVLTTRLLDPRRALIQALSLSREVRVSPSPLRYLGVPDVARLRGNIHRLRQSAQGAATRLAELLEVEYSALGRAAQQNPATGALAGVLRGINGRPTVLLVSQGNHDVVALAFNQYALQQKGYRLVHVGLAGKGNGMPLAPARP